MISKKQFILGLLLASFCGALLALGVARWFLSNKKYNSFEERQNIRFSSLKDADVVVPEGLNFIYAAEIVAPAVVHIQTSLEKKKASYNGDPLEDMFKQFHGKGYNIPKSSSGSGVIISDDGYIATNNHVIEGAEVIEVVLKDKRSYRAKLVGTDPSMDLALLKIEEDELPFVKYADSDKVKVGEWVLAVGNPFDLTSTVTAGIISAKARSINIIRTSDNLQVESFLQTDAVVNPGNSGGALVNLKGELVGVNTAIASETGSYQGYSFAVPVNLVKKVMNDLLNYGEVQRALLGVHIADVDAKFAEEMGLESVQGVYISGVNKSSGADEAGLQEGDVIISIDETSVNSIAQLQSIIASKRPGDKVTMLYKRGTTEREASVLLKNKMGNVEVIKKTARQNTSILGAELTEISEKEKRQLNINIGIKVAQLKTGKMQDAGIQQGFIITHISLNGKRQAIKNANDIINALTRAEEGSMGIYLEGVYENGDRAYYPIGW